MRRSYYLFTIITLCGVVHSQDNWGTAKGKARLTPSQERQLEQEQRRSDFIRDHYDEFVDFVRQTAEDEEEFDEFMHIPDLRNQLEDRFIQAHREEEQFRRGPTPESWEELVRDGEEGGEIYIPPTVGEGAPAGEPAGEEPSYFDAYREGFMRAWDRWMEAVKSLPSTIFTAPGSAKLVDLVVAPAAGHIDQALVDELKRNLRDPNFDLARALTEDAGFRTALENFRQQDAELNMLLQERLAQMGPAPVPTELPPAVLPPEEDGPVATQLELPIPVEATGSVMSLDEEYPTLEAAAATPQPSRRERQLASPRATPSAGTSTRTRSPRTRLTPDLRPNTPSNTEGQYGPLNETVITRANPEADRVEYDIYDAENNAQITLFFPNHPLWRYGQLDFAHFDYPTQEEFARGTGEEGHVLDWFTRGGQDVRMTRAYEGGPERILEQTARHRWTITIDNFIPTEGNWFNRGFVFPFGPNERHLYIIGRITIRGRVLWGAFRYIFMRRGTNWWVIQRYFVLAETQGIVGIMKNEIIRQRELTRGTPPAGKF